MKPRHNPPAKRPQHPQARHAAVSSRHAAAPRESGVVIGRLSAHRDGYGFVLPETPEPGMEGDLFIPRDALGDAMHGDRVRARITSRRRDGRFEGRIEQVLKRAHPAVVGVFHYAAHRGAASERGNRVIPFDTRITQEIIIPPGEELAPELRRKLGASPRGAKLPELDGAVVNVVLTRFPRGGVLPAGRVVEILGRPGDLGVDVEIIIRKHHLPHEFSEDALEEARRIPQQVSEQDARAPGRRDFRRLPIVTIDGETAKDFDDAVYVERLANHHFALQAHIADVAHYVARGSALDREARLRGSSVYFPDRAVPMLPEELSSGICSLRPRVDRLVMSALLEFDARGRRLRAEFTPGVICSAERMTYTAVNAVLEGQPQAAARFASLASHFRLMKELALLLHARRSARGSIDFDLPEPVIEFDPQGRMQSITRSERNIAHRIIEEFMLAANEAVAALLEERVFASLHRVHEPPDPGKILEFEELARAFGYSLGVADLAERRITVRHATVRGGRAGARERPMRVLVPEEVHVRPQHYQALVSKIAGKPEERILSYLMLRSLKQARYASEPLGHFALACDMYTHFTSPIRRYPDLIVHRVLKAALSGAARQHAPHRAAAQHNHASPRGASRGPYALRELEEIAAESSEAERRADAAERELMDWKTAQFMEEHLGEEYDALIISVHRFGFFVELFEVFVEGLVPIGALEELTGERCYFRENDRSIVAARGRRAFRLGDRLRVRADRVDPITRRVEFTPLA